MIDPFLRLRQDPQPVEPPEGFLEELRARYLAVLDEAPVASDDEVDSVPDEQPSAVPLGTTEEAALEQRPAESATIVLLATAGANARRRHWLVAAVAVIVLVAGIVIAAVARDDSRRRVSTGPGQQTTTTTQAPTSTQSGETASSEAPSALKLAGGVLNGAQLSTGTTVADASAPAGLPEPCPGRPLTATGKALERHASSSWNGPNAPFGVAFTQWIFRLQSADDAAGLLRSLREAATCDPFDAQTTQQSRYSSLTLRELSVVTPAGVAETAVLAAMPNGSDVPVVAWVAMRVSEVAWVMRIEDTAPGGWLTAQHIQDALYVEAGVITRTVPPDSNPGPAPAEVDEASFGQIVANPNRFKNTRVTVTGKVLLGSTAGAMSLGRGAWIPMLAGPDQAWPVAMGLPQDIAPASLPAGSVVTVTGTVSGRFSDTPSNGLPFPFTGVAVQVTAITVHS